MAEGPYVNLPYAELSQLHLRYWQSGEVLKAIVEELRQRERRHRDDVRTQSLIRILSTRIQELGRDWGTPGYGQPVGFGAQQAQEPAAAVPPVQEPRTSAHYEQRLRDLSTRALRAEQQVADLKRMLRAAEQKASEPRSASRTSKERLFAQLGLVPECPAFVLDAVKRAFRKRFHPDPLPPAEKHSAQEEFKRYEIIFDQLSKL